MRYYHFGISIDPKVIGRRNAGEQVMIDENNVTDKELLKKVQDFFMRQLPSQVNDNEPDFEVSMERVTQVKGAKMTDIVRFCPNLYTCPFMLSHKAATFLRNYNLGKHAYYPVYMDDNGAKEHKLSLLRLPYLGFEYIDFSRSVFKRGYEIMNDLEYHRFLSQQEFEDHEEMASLEPVGIYLNDKFDKSLDMLDLRHVGLLMSEKLMNAIREEGLTGIDVYSTPTVDIK